MIYLCKAGYKDLCIESLPPTNHPRDSNYFPRPRKRGGVVVAYLPLEIVVVESSNKKNIYEKEIWLLLSNEYIKI